MLQFRLLFIIIFSLQLLGCAPNYLYHSPNNGCKPEDAALCSSDYIQQRDGYILGFVEIDDKGWFRDRNQLDAFVQMLQQTADDDVLLLVYAHGWKHNASNEDRDMLRMHSTLAHLHAVEQYSDHPRQVIGLYIGWRGLSVTAPVLKELSFWDRKSTAHNAGESANEVFTKLQLVMDNKRALSDHPNSTYVVIGHSFGGALVYSAIRPIIVSRLSKQLYDNALLERQNSNSDLVVLLNPAFEASRVKELREQFKSIHAAPYLVILTADNDQATKKAFPIGRHLSTIFDKYSSKAQQKADRKTIGHYQPFFTHKLVDTGPAKGNGCHKVFSDYQQQINLSVDNQHIDQWLRDYANNGHSLLLNDSSINHVSADINADNPIQIIRVEDRDILDKHSNIICDDLVDLIRTYLIFNSRYSATPAGD
jgi:hypothetical protein